MDPGSAYYDDDGGGFAPLEVIANLKTQIQDLGSGDCGYGFHAISSGGLDLLDWLN